MIKTSSLLSKVFLIRHKSEYVREIIIGDHRLMRSTAFIVGVGTSIIFILISTLLPSSLAYISGSFIGLGTALLGAFCVMWYETSKDNMEKREKRQKALNMVYMDVTQSLGPLETAPKEGMLMFSPFPRLGWDILTMTGTFNLKSELDRKIADVYERLISLNAMNNWALSFRFSPSRALESFPRVMQALTELIHEQIDILVPRLKTIKTEIENELGLMAKKKT